LKPGRKIHQALSALTRDFYVPRNVGTLFAELYPDEYFNADSSPTRVRQIFKRTRRWFEDSGIPAAIAVQDGGYRLKITGAFALEVPFHNSPVSANEAMWSRLVARFKNSSFSVRQATDHLQISASGFHRLIEWACQQELVDVSGLGKATRYRFKKSAA
jgi:hypothetical protein